MRLWTSAGLVLVLVVSAACDDDSGPASDGDTGSVTDSTSFPKDDVVGPSFDTTVLPPDSVPLKCTAGSTDPCDGNKTLYCLNGTCTKCPGAANNCNGIEGCECIGACDGTTCVGTRTCDFSDNNVCSGDQSQYCKDNQCVACPSGYANCDKTKECECQGTCKGSKCI